MSFSGGVYTLPGPALVTGEVVSATENNQFRNDVAGAFNLTMLRNGTSTATANLPMGGYKLTGLGAATTSGDALAYGAAAVVTTLTSTSLTATRVPYAGTGGLLQDTSTFTFDGTTLTAGGFSTSGNISAATATVSGNITVSGGTANGVAYLNGSKVLTTGSALTFDGTNLGIGTSSPSGKLDVTGSNGKFYVGATGNEAYFSFNSGNYFRANGGSSAFLDIGGQSYLRFSTGSGFAEAMRIDSSGNVGIGTSSPGGRLDVLGADDSVMYMRNASAVLRFRPYVPSLNAGQIACLNSGLSVYAQLNLSGNPLVFEASGTERMRIDSSGRVIIGGSSALISGDKLSVYSTIATYGYECRSGVSGSFSGNSFNINWTGSPALWVDATNLGNIQLSSDYRIKQNVETQTDSGIDRVMKLRPVVYEYTNYGKLFKADGIQREGFIAHEVQAVIPSGAEGEKDEEGRIQNLRLDAILSVAVKAIQELSVQTTALKAELDATKAEVAALKGV